MFGTDGVNITLSCNYSSAISLQWYRQYPGSAPEFLLIIIHRSGEVSQKSKIVEQDPRFSGKVNEQKTSQVTYVTMVPRVGNETLRPLGVATGNALSVTRSEDTYEKTPPVGRRQPMTSLPAYHNISAAGRIHHQLLRLKLASEAWLKAQGTQCLVPHSGNHGYIRNLRRSPSWELELRPLGVATGNVIPTSPC